MNRTLLILKREYLSRVKKPAFVIMTILGPIIFAALAIAPALLAQIKDDDEKRIAVIDDSFLFCRPDSMFLSNTEQIKFFHTPGKSVGDAHDMISDTTYFAVLYIPAKVANGGEVRLYSKKQPSLNVKMYISNTMENQLKELKLAKKGKEKGISKADMDDIIRAVDTKVSVSTIKLDESGAEKRTSTEIATVLGYIAGFLIYMFVFMYGAQVMRGVIEEKTNRIVEVIVSSVRPFTLMMGKIIGVAFVGLTQFILWVLLTFLLVTGAKAIFFPDMEGFRQTPQVEQVMQQTGDQGGEFMDASSDEVSALFESFRNINFPLIIGSFLFYFIGGYLLYAAMFAAVGSAVDNETDTQQFMLPITVPLILALIVMVSSANNPEGPLAYWFSIIPFTSPVVMMMRIPFGVPLIDMIISMSLLVICFIFMVWLAGKIYRTGILMYGKKVNYREIWKWIRYKS